jgi:transposase
MLDNSLVHPYPSSRRRGLFFLYPSSRMLVMKAGSSQSSSKPRVTSFGSSAPRKRAFEVVGLTWSVERTFAWIRRFRRMSKDYEPRVQTSETLIDLMAIRLMLDRLVKT